MLDFRRAFWTPPLTPRQACRLEQRQIEAELQIPGLISLTDHDDIRACNLLKILDRFRNAPISTEWSVPFGTTLFHVGIHNMPYRDASDIMQELTSFTADPREEKLAGIFAMLRSYPDTLLVLNHALMDETGVGRSEHAQGLDLLLRQHARSFDALEVNGLRSWMENQQVIRLAQQTGLPVISGGDRHGLEPNAILNLSRAATSSRVHSRSAIQKIEPRRIHASVPAATKAAAPAYRSRHPARLPNEFRRPEKMDRSRIFS